MTSNQVVHPAMRNKLGLRANKLVHLDICAKITFGVLPIGTGANTVAADDDTRLSHARTSTDTAGGDCWHGSYQKQRHHQCQDRQWHDCDEDIADSTISDAKLAGITKAGKVSGAAITAGTLAGTSGFAGSGGVFRRNDGATGSDLCFFRDNNTNYLGLKAPNGVTTNTTWTLPASDATSGQVLSMASK